MITVVNKYKHKPTPNDVFCGRGSPLGNPFTHLDLDKTKAAYQCATREESITRHEEYFNELIRQKDLAICKALNNIVRLAKSGDVFLVCYCKPKSCHCDTIKRIVDAKIN